MDLSVLQTLEYYKIRRILVEKAGSVMGKEKADELVPDRDMAEIKRRLAETGEARLILDSIGNIPLGGIREIRPFLKRAQVGSILEPHELLAVHSTLYASRRIKNFLANLELPVFLLKGYGDNIAVLRNLENVIENIIDEHGNIRDDASVELLRIRREVKASQGKVKDRLDSILRSLEYQKYFQDALVTMRGDRYVIPIKQEYRHSFPGIIHDQSASGATVFIEPMAIVNLNNDIKQLMAAEKNEIARILQNATAQVAKVTRELMTNCEMLAQLDFAVAKAQLSMEMQAVAPELNQKGQVRLIQARHPLISQESVVPIDIYIGETFNTLLITGPNTGGKTVSLKTLGLFALMTQAGLFIPVGSGSKMAVFDNIFADIGDEQSIEQSLSTFSAHMTNLVKIIEAVSARDLVLIDEIGAGTDPDEGAALAMALLAHLMKIGVRTVATTHYSELKTFAYSTPGVENASVEFDVNTLRPTYRLMIGIPGSSNAFAISKRLGLSTSIIDSATQFLDKDHAKFEKVLSALEEEKVYFVTRNAEIAEQEHTLTLLENKLQAEQREWQEKKTKIITRAQEDAAALMRQARREAEAVIKELKAQFAEHNSAQRQRAIESSRKRLLDTMQDVQQKENEGAALFPATAAALKPGMMVYVTTLKQKGAVLYVSEQEVTVQMGIMKMNVPISACSLLEGDSKGKIHSPKKAAMNFTKSMETARQIDIRGITVEEAEDILAKYLDDALLAGLNEVMVIHGKGTGALRKGVREYLRNHHHVQDIQIAQFNEGGDGATVVHLK